MAQQVTDSGHRHSIDGVAMNDAIPVRLIATPRDSLMTCFPHETVAQVQERNTNVYDYIPVVEDAGSQTRPIIGLLNTTKFSHSAAPNGVVRDHTEPLREEYLIGADAGILHFIRDADKHGCRLVISGPEITGIITLSDIQRLPVRAALFGAITQFEMTMTDAINRDAPDPEIWMERLNKRRREKVEERIAAAREAGTFVSDLLCTQFCDKREIIRKSPNFGWNKTKFDGELTRIEKLRNAIAHANMLATTRDEEKAVCETVRLIGHWSAHLTNWPVANAG